MNESEWTRHNPRPQNFQHAPARPRPVSRSAILIALAVLVAGFGVVVAGVWWLVGA